MPENLNCSICHKLVRNNSKAIFCDFCKTWIHPKCNLLSSRDFDVLSNSDPNEVWSCLKCNSEILPFCSDQSSEVFAPNPNLDSSLFFTKLNSIEANFSDTSEDEPFGTSDCKYYNVNEFNSVFTNQTKSPYLSFLHLNINSLPKHFEELQEVLDSIEHNFSIIGISESRISNSTPKSFSLDKFSCFSTPTEELAGGLFCMYLIL